MAIAATAVPRRARLLMLLSLHLSELPRSDRYLIAANDTNTVTAWTRRTRRGPDRLTESLADTAHGISHLAAGASRDGAALEARHVAAGREGRVLSIGRLAVASSI